MKRAGWLAAWMLAGCVAAPAPRVPPPPLRAPRIPRQAPIPTAAALTAGRYPTLARAVAAAGLTPMLTGTAPVTLLAPDEAAWAQLAPGVLDALLKPENRGSLRTLLRFHVIPGRISRAELAQRAAIRPITLPTLAGEPVMVMLTGGRLVLADANGHRVALVNQEASAANSIVQEVDGLLVPQALGPQPQGGVIVKP